MLKGSDPFSKRLHYTLILWTALKHFKAVLWDQWNESLALSLPNYVHRVQHMVVLLIKFDLAGIVRSLGSYCLSHPSQRIVNTSLHKTPKSSETAYLSAINSLKVGYVSSKTMIKKNKKLSNKIFSDPESYPKPNN